MKASLRRRKLHRPGALPVLIAVAALVATVSVSGTANAVHATGAFELDGNAVNDAGTAGDDWDNVCHQVTITQDAAANPPNQIPDQCATAADTNGATATSWVSEPNLNSSIFTGGGSKDPSDVSSWAWKDGAGGLPDKDNLLHSFAARYSLTPTDTGSGPGTCPSSGAPTCEVLFFGSDRDDNSGDAQQGFWFFQNSVSLGTTPLGGGTAFRGVHRAGDILVISDFSNGGGTSTITVYKWDPTCKKTNVPDPDCGDSNLRTLETSTDAKCAASLADSDTFCGIVNPTDGTTSPWSFTDKSGKHTFLNGELYEGGVNLSALGLGAECFSSVASETRSSTSTTAVLKDFVLGPLGQCDSAVVTTPKDGSGAAIPQGGLNIGTDGTVTAKDSAAVTVHGVATWNGTVQFGLCGPSATTGCTAAAATAIGTPVAVSNTNNPVLSPTATVTAAGSYCWRADFSGTTTGVPGASDGSANECFTVNPVQPTLATSAGADVDLGNPVTDTATLAGTANEPGSNVIGGPAGGVAAGSISFSLFGPSTSGCGALVGTVTPATPVSGDNTYGPVSLTPTAPGTYHWVASYTGDSPNTLGVTHNATCNDANEDVVVNQVPTSLTTHQFVFPQDKATVTATGGGNLGGSMTFKLYDSLTNCQSDGGTPATGLLYSEGPLTVSGASPQSKTTSNTTVRISSNATVYWRVTYASTNQAQLASSSVCTESTAVTYTGNDSGISIP